ncbi:MAG TPA: hypothetical protein VF884_08545 [Nitrososphaeraceae archaeon]
MLFKHQDRSQPANIDEYKGQAWFKDLEKLANDELMRVFNTIKSGGYEFAKDAWYIPRPLAYDERCPVMVAKGYSSPDTPEKMIKFQDIARLLQVEFKEFIDAWDFGLITEDHIVNAILRIIESRTVAVMK